MIKNESIQVFTRVSEMQSFTKAADSLGLPKASVSTIIQQLETQIGTRLFHRTTRKVQLTQDGAAFYERSKDLLSDVDEIESMFQQGPQKVTGRIRVDMPTGFAKHHLLPRLPEFISQFPGIEIELSCTDRFVDVIREGFDCVIRAGKLTDSSLMARKLGEYPIINCASRAYIQKYGEPKSLLDLTKHSLVSYSSNLNPHSDGFEYYDGAIYRKITLPSRITVNNADAYIASCLAGFGIIQSPKVGLKPYLEEGSLVEILKNVRSEPMSVWIVYPHRRNLAKRVQLFMDWVTTIFPKE